MSDSRVSWSVSGRCERCSVLAGKPVLHGTAWCPRIYASAWTDSNGHASDGSAFICHWALSRPVDVGELVWVYDTGDGDDEPFATWGRVTERHEDGSVRVSLIGETQPWTNTWVYVPAVRTVPEDGENEPAAGSQNNQGDERT